MFFIFLTFLAALAIEAIGTLVSVIGLSALFGSNPIIIALAVSLDVGKIVVVTLLYKYWSQLSRIMKAYGLLAAFVTVTITSAGAAGYLSGEFQKAILGTQETSLKVDLLKDEQARLQKRKDQIDQQIASLPERFSASQRIRMINQFKQEQASISERLTQIDRELPSLKLTQISTETKAGPILYISRAFNITVEEAVKWVILLIIFVFDPLAVFLVIAGNFLLNQHRKNKTAAAPKAGVFVEDSDKDHPKAVPVEKMMQATQEPTANTVAVEVSAPTLGEEHPLHDNVDKAVPKQASSKMQPGEEPQEITKSSLGIVRPDPTVKMSDTGEIGYRTGVYRSGIQPK